MSEQKKTNKRKILTRTLILAACILVIAAITVTTVFAVNDWGRNDIHIDSGTNQPNQGNNGGEDNKPNQGNNGGEDNKPNQGDNKPASSSNEFASPVAVVDIATGYDFGKDVTLGHWHFHTGLDMKADAGTAVMACLDGTVESIITEDKLDGTSVTISHANGLKTVYTFIEAKSGLKKGDTVKKGDVIGSVAEANGSEYLLGSHLHFEVFKNGEWVDPTDYLNGSIK